MRYEEFPPSPLLARWIECYWLFEGHYDTEVPETIVADGYPELIVHIGNPYREVDSEGTVTTQPRAVACGQLTRPLTLQSLGQVGIVAIRFRPAGMVPFARVPMRSLTDQRVDAGEVFGGMRQFIDDLERSMNDNERVRACEQFLFESAESVRPGSQIVDRAISLIQRDKGGLRVESLADHLALAGVLWSWLFNETSAFLRNSSVG